MVWNVDTILNLHILLIPVSQLKWREMGNFPKEKVTSQKSFIKSRKKISLLKHRPDFHHSIELTNKRQSISSSRNKMRRGEE